MWSDSNRGCDVRCGLPSLSGNIFNYAPELLVAPKVTIRERFGSGTSRGGEKRLQTVRNSVRITDSDNDLLIRSKCVILSGAR